MICHSQYHVSESCIDKLKRTAVHLTSLGGRYDLVLRTDRGLLQNTLDNLLRGCIAPQRPSRVSPFCCSLRQSNISFSHRFMNSYFMYISQQVSNPRGPGTALHYSPVSRHQSASAVPLCFLTASLTVPLSLHFSYHTTVFHRISPNATTLQCLPFDPR